MAKKQRDTILRVLKDIRDMLKKTVGAGQQDNPIPKRISDRFTDNGDNTVTDNLLGVAWVKDPSKVPGLEDTMDFAAAEKVCAGLKHAGKNDWRMPTVKELCSIIDYGRHDPAWNTDVFGGRHNDWYWTGTTCAWNSGAAWCVSSNYGDVGYDGEDFHSYVCPVRSSQ